MKFVFKSIIKNIFFTFAAEAAVLISFFGIYRLIAFDFGSDGVGEYSLVKRVVALLTPIFILGLGVGLPRYISISKLKNQAAAYIQSGVLAVIAATILFLVFINIVIPRPFAAVFFGSDSYINLVWPFSIFLAGLVLYSLVYAALRGFLMVKTFNLFKIITLAFIPVVIIAIMKHTNIANVLIATGITTLVVSLLASLFMVNRIFFRTTIKELIISLKELLCYSLPRVFGTFSHLAIISLSPIIAAHYASIREVGYISLSQSLLVAIGSMISPLGLILLPVVGNLASQQREQEIKTDFNLLIGAVIQCSVFACVQLIIFADVIVVYWLGVDFLSAVTAMRITFMSVVFYIFYGLVESVLDAVHAKPMNTINLFFALMVFLGFAGVLLFFFGGIPPVISLSVAFAAGLICLGIMSYISIRKIFASNPIDDFKSLILALAVSGILGGIAYFVKSKFTISFPVLILFEVFLGIFYLIMLWLAKVHWVRLIPSKFFDHVD